MRIYDDARTYLATQINTDMQCLRISRVDEAQGIIVTMDQGEEMVDAHGGVDYTWCHVSYDNSATAAARAAYTTTYAGAGANGRARGHLEVKSFEVTFHTKHKEKALKSYLPFVVATTKAMKDQHRNLKMHMI